MYLRGFFVSLGLAAVFWPLAVFAQASTGCCFNGSGYCLDGLSRLACDSSYQSGNAGSNFYSGQSCDLVSQCAFPGKCEKTGGVDCKDLKKWECDVKYTSGYSFFQGQTCNTSAPVGSCCVQPPSAGRTVPDCQDSVNKTSCDNQLGSWYNTACSGVSNCPQATTGAPPLNTETDSNLPDILFTPEVPLPDFAGGPITGQTMAQYIRAVFIYFIWTVGILATIMVIYGGVKWVAAAGNPGRINDARETINNAIIGVIIALTSVLLLNTINPNLVNFKGLTIKPVARQLLAIDNTPGENGEEKTCQTVKNTPVQAETSCVMGKERLAWPVGDSPLDITSPVGPRDCEGCSKCHSGTDFSTNKAAGQPIIAVFDGTIQNITTVCAEPSMQLLSEDGKYYARYVHLSNIIFGNGTKVKRGQVIGYSGGANPPSSCSQGPHLHLELYGSDRVVHDIAPCVLQ